MRGWEHLGRTAAADLVGGRRSLHHAAQIVASVGITHVPAAADDSHTNMEWLPSIRALAGSAVAGARPFRVAARPEGLEILLLDADGREVDARGLVGSTIDEGYAWASRAIARWTGSPERALDRPSWTIPPLGHETFSGADDDALGELARWYGNAAHALRALADDFDGASEVRCWPHHFDIATLLPGGAAGQTVGAGLSPGDDTYGEPYWYVSPYPHPKDPVLPTLPEGGRWHRDGFFAAVLTGGDLLAGGAEGTQERRSRWFLEAAVADSLRLLRG